MSSTDDLLNGEVDPNTGLLKSEVKPQGTTSSDIDPLYSYQPGEQMGMYGTSMFDEGIINRNTIENIEYMRGENQPWYAQFGAGAARMIPGTAMKIAEGAGFLYGAGKALMGGEFSDIYDNDVVNTISKLDEQMRNELLPIYSTYAYENDGFLGAMGSAKFWANDLFDGIEFALSAYAPGALIGKAGAAMKLGANAKKVLQLGGATAYNTITEAGFEAKDVAKGIDHDLRGKINTDGLYSTEELQKAKDIITKQAQQQYSEGTSDFLPVQMSDEFLEEEAAKLAKANAQGKQFTESQIKEMKGSGAKTTFYGNMAMLAASNLAEAIFMHGLPSSNKRALTARAARGDVSAGDISMIRELGKGVGTGIASEGLWEENIQLAISNYATDLAEGRDSNLASEYLRNFTTDEGLKSMVLGGLIGGPMAGRRSYLDTQEDLKAIATGEREDFRTKNQKVIDDAQTKLQENIKSPLRQKGTREEEFEDEDGTKHRRSVPIYADESGVEVDPGISTKIMRQVSVDDKVKADNAMANIDGSGNKAEYTSDLALGRYLYSYLTNPLYDDTDHALREAKDWLNVYREENTNGDAATLEALNVNTAKLDQLKQYYDTIENKLLEDAPLRQLTDEEKLQSSIARRAYFLEGVNQIAYENMKSNAKDDAAIEQLDSFIEQSKAKQEMLLDQGKRVSMFEGFSLDVNGNYTYSPVKEMGKRLEKNRKELRELDEKQRTSVKTESGKLPKEDRINTINEEITSLQAKVESLKDPDDAELNKEEIDKLNSDIKTKEEERASIENEPVENIDLQSEIDAKQKEVLVDELLVEEEIAINGVENQFNILVDEANRAKRKTPIRFQRMEELGTARAQDMQLKDMIGEGASTSDIMRMLERKTIVDQKDIDKVNAKIEGDIVKLQEELDLAQEEGDEFEVEEIQEQIDELVDLMDNEIPQFIKSEPMKDMTENDFKRVFANKKLEQLSTPVNNYENDNSYSDIDAVQDAEVNTVNAITAYENRPDNILSTEEFDGYLKSLEDLLVSLRGISKSVAENASKRTKEQSDSAKNEADTKQAMIGILAEESDVELISELSKLDKDIDAIYNKLDSKGINLYQKAIYSDLIVDKIKGKKDQILSFIDNKINEYAIELNDTGLFKSSIDKLAINVNGTFYNEFAAKIVGSVILEQESTNFDSPITRYDRNRSLSQLNSSRYNIPHKEKFSGVMLTDDMVAQVVNNAFNLDRYQKLKLAISTSGTVKDRHDSEAKVTNAEVKAAKRENRNPFLPTTQQVVALREAYSLIDKMDTAAYTKPFGGWMFLRGVAGTGKTAITSRLLKQLNYDIDANVIVGGTTQRQADNLAKGVYDNVEAKGQNIESIIERPILDDVKLIVIDEIAAATDQQLMALADKIQFENTRRISEGKDPISTFTMGDPNQLTAEEQPNITLNSTKGIENMVQLSPLTMPLRSDIGSINTFSNTFNNSSNEVLNLTTKYEDSNRKGVNVVYSRNELINNIKHAASENSDRTKALLVNDENAVESYRDLEQFGVIVMPYVQAQGFEYDEVYIDIDVDGNDHRGRAFRDRRNLKEFNSAIYTSASRAKQSIQYLDRSGTFNTVPLSIKDTLGVSSNDIILNENRGIYDDRFNVETSALADEGFTFKEEDKVSVDVNVTPEENNIEEEELSETIEVDNELDPYNPDDISDSDLTEQNDMSVGEDIASGKTDTLYNDGDNTVHVIKETTYANLMRIKIGENSFAVPKLKEDTPVRYVKIERLADDAVPMVGIYALWDNDTWKQIGVMSDSDLNSDHPMAKEIKSRFDKSDSYSVNYKGGEHLDVDGKLTHRRALSYIYQDKPVELGSESVVDRAINQWKKAFVTDSGIAAEDVEGIMADAKFEIKTITKKYLTEDKEKRKSKRSGQGLTDNASFNPIPGVTYMIMSGMKIGKKSIPTQYIRLSTKPLSETDSEVVVLKEALYHINKIENISDFRLGEDSFNKVLSLFKNNYVPTDNYTLKKNDNNTDVLGKDKFGVTLDEVGIQFTVNDNGSLEELYDAFDSLIPMLYGVEPKTMKFNNEEQAGQYIVDYLNGDKSYTVEKDKDIYRILYKKEHYIKEKVLWLGKGEAQGAINRLARANKYVGDTVIRKEIKDRSGKKVITGKKIHSVGDTKEDDYSSLYAQVRKELNKKGKKIPLYFTPDDTGFAVFEKAVTTGLDEDQIQRIVKNQKLSKEAEAKLRDLKGSISHEDLNRIWRDILEQDSFSSQVLKDIVDNFTNGEHSMDVEHKEGKYKGQVRNSYLRKPILASKPKNSKLDTLGVEQLNEMLNSRDDTKVQRAKEEINKLFNLKLRDIKPTSATVTIERPVFLKKDKSSAKTDDDTFEGSDEIPEVGEDFDIDQFEADNLDFGRFYEDIFDVPKGKLIRKEDAESIIRRHLPSISDEDVQFMRDVVYDNALTSGTSVLGLYKYGKLKYKIDGDGRLYTGALYHELFHKIYNEHLTPQEKNRLYLAVKRQYPNEIKRIEATYTNEKRREEEIEEFITRLFQTYSVNKKSGLRRYIKEIFNKILRWLGILDNTNAVSAIFGDIYNNTYKERTSPTNTVRRLSNIVDIFGSVSNYRELEKIITTKFYDLTTNGVNGRPASTAEIRAKVKDILVGRKKYLEAAINKFKDLRAKQTSPETKKRYDNAIYAAQMDYQKYKRLFEYDKEDKQKIYNDLMKAIYPNWDYYKPGTIGAFYERTDEELEELYDGRNADILKGINAETLDTEVISSELKQTNRVKDALSNIYVESEIDERTYNTILKSRPEDVSKRKGRFYDKLGTRLNERFVFFKMMQLFEYIDTSGDIKTQLYSAANREGSNRITEAIVNRVLEIYETGSTNKIVSQDGKIIRLPEHIKVLDESAIAIHKEGTSIRERGRTSLEDDPNVTVEKRDPNERVADFLDRIHDNQGEIDGLYIKYINNRLFADMGALFSSLQRSDVRIAYHKNAFGKPVMSYITGKSLSAMNGISNSIIAAFDTLLKKGFADSSEVLLEDFDFVDYLKSSKITTRYNWKKDIESKLKKKNEETVVGIKNFLNYIGLGYLTKDGLPNDMESSFKVADDILGFIDRLDQLEQPIGSVISETTEDGSEVQREITLNDVFNTNRGFLNRLSDFVGKESKYLRANTFFNGEGKKVFSYSVSNAGLDVLNNLIRNRSFRGKGSYKGINGLPLPKFMRPENMSNFFKNNIFVAGHKNKAFNVIHEVITHDSIKTEGAYSDTTSVYKNESDKDWLSRNFIFGFLSYFDQSSSSSRGRYIQFEQTLSNRPKIYGATLDVLKQEEMKPVYRQALYQLASRNIELESVVDDYNASSTVNFEIVNEAFPGRDFKKSPLTVEEIDNDGDAIVDRMITALENKARELAKTLVAEEVIWDQTSMEAIGNRMVSEGIVSDKYINEETGKLDNQITSSMAQRLSYQEAQEQEVPRYLSEIDGISKVDLLIPFADAFVKNYYINNYMLHQFTGGDAASFKDSLAVIKRNQTAYSPGTKPVVGTDYTRDTFRCCIVKDPAEGESIKEYVDSLISNQEDRDKLLVDFGYYKTDINGNILLDKDGNKIVNDRGVFNPNDGMGLMFDDRWDNLNQGLGDGYLLADVMKPVHFENSPYRRLKLLEEGYQLKENEFVKEESDDKGSTKWVYVKETVPVLLKYASFRVSEDLAKRNPKLLALRDLAKAKNIDELVFNTGIKAGAPTSIADPELMLREDYGGQEFPRESVLELSNSNYKVQLNPYHEVDSETAMPTQLMYLLNTLTEDRTSANRVYDSLAKIIEFGSKKFDRKLGNLEDTVRGELTGAGNEMVLELLEDEVLDKEIYDYLMTDGSLKDKLYSKGDKYYLKGVSLDHPYVINKVGLHLSALLNRMTVKVKFPGSKLILRSTYGIGKLDNETKEIADKLTYGVDENDRLYYEVILPKGIMSRSEERQIEKDIKEGKDIYLLPDLLGFRIPSSGLHSAVPLKVKSFYDSKGTNTVIAPNELIPVTGWDFDVDSLFIIRRERHGRKFDARGTSLYNNEIDNLENLIAKELDDYDATNITYEEDKIEVDKAMVNELIDLLSMQKEAYVNRGLDTGIAGNTDIELRFNKYVEDRGKEDNRSNRYAFAKIIGTLWVENESKWEAMEKGTMNFNIAKFNTDTFIGSNKIELGRILPDSINKISGLSIFGVNVNEPVGYKLTKDGYAFNEQYGKQLETLHSKLDPIADEKYINQIEAILEQYHKNRVLDIMLDVISHKKNRYDMVKPISMVELHRIKDKYASRFVPDLSDPLHNLAAYRSNFQGLAMTGVTANNMKVAAYKLWAAKENGNPSLRAIDRENPNTKETEKFRHTIKIDGVTYDKLRMFDTDGNKVSDTMDSLVNASIDNVKEQIIYDINYNGSTGNPYAVLLQHGIPIESVVVTFIQPKIKEVADMPGSSAYAIRKITSEFKNKLEKYLGELDVDYYVSKKGIDLDKLKKIADIQKKDPDVIDTLFSNLDNNIKVSESESLLKEQYNLLQFMTGVYDIAEYDKKISDALGVINGIPVFYYEQRKMLADWNFIFPKNKDGIRELSDSVPYDISELIETSHIKSALAELERIVAYQEENFVRYNKELDSLVDSVLNSKDYISIDLTKGSAKRGQYRNADLVKEELMKYAMATMYDFSNTTPVDIKYSTKKKGTTFKTLTGSQAWSYNHAMLLKDLIKFDENLVNREASYEGNAFLNALEIIDNYKTNIPKVRFTIGGDIKTPDIIELQQAFDQLRNYKIETVNGKNKISYVKNSDTIGYTDLQRDILKYASVMYGMKFGTSNFIMTIPKRLMLEHDIAFNKLITSDAFYDNLKGMKSHFALELAANNSESVKPFYEKPVLIKTVPVSEEKKVKVYSGSEDGVEFDLKFEREEGSNITYPKIIVKNSKLYRRISDTEADTIYYKSLGYVRNKSTYSVTKENFEKGYDVDKMVRQDIKYVGINKLGDVKFKDNYRSYEVGEKVMVHLHSDIGFASAKEAIIVNKKGATYTVEYVKPKPKKKLFEEMQRSSAREFNSKAARESLSLMANSLASKTGIEWEVDNEMEDLGQFRDGKVFINMNKATLDTPFHEFAHPFIRSIRLQNEQLFNKWITEIDRNHKKVLDAVRLNYRDEGLSELELYEEAMAETIGKFAADDYKRSDSKLRNLVSILDQFFRWIGNLFNANRKINENSELKDVAMAFRYNTKIENYFTLDDSGNIVYRQKDKDNVDISNTLEDALNLQYVDGKLIEIDLDADGNELDTYNDGKFNRMTGDTGLANEFTEREVNRDISLPERIANRLFGKHMKSDEFDKDNDKLNITELGTVSYNQVVEYYNDIFESGRRKGTITHKYIEHIALEEQMKKYEEGTPDHTLLKNKASDVSAEINELIDLGFKRESFSWINANKETILNTLQVDFSRGDSFIPEYTIVSDELGVATTADAMIAYGDGIYSIKDFKTGTKFNSAIFNNLLRFGKQTINITDNSRERAKLEIMLRAMMFKYNMHKKGHNIKFRDLEVVWMPNENVLLNGDKQKKVETYDYMNMVKEFMKSDYRDVYDKWEKAGMFKVEDYTKASYDFYKKDSELNDIGKSLLEKSTEDLTAIIKSATTTDLLNKGDKERAAKLAETILEVYRDPEIAIKDVTTDISAMAMWVGQYADTNNPMLQTFKKIQDKMKTRAATKINRIQRELDVLTKAVYDDYIRTSGKSKVHKITKGWIGKVPIDDFWSFAYTNENISQPDSKDTNVYKQQVLITESHKEQWARLTDNQKKLLTYMQDHMASVFSENGVANKVVTTKLRGGKPRKVTNLELLNWSKDVGQGFSYDKYGRMFMPRVPVSGREIRNRHGIISKEYKDYLIDRYATMYYEDSFEEWNNQDDVLPLKYLGTDSMILSGNYSRDLYDAFTKFMANSIRKEFMDDVYSIGQGVRLILRGKGYDEGNSKAYSNAMQMLERKMEAEILSKPSIPNLFTRTPFSLGKRDDGSERNVNLYQVIKSMKRAVTMPVMWYKFRGGGRNGLFVWLFNQKEALKGTISASKFTGVNGNEIDFTQKDLWFAHGEWASLQKDYMLGNERFKANKLWLLSKELNYLPDDFEYAIEDRDRVLLGNKALDAQTAYMPYSRPETWNANMVLAAQLNRMKVKGNDGKMISVWDAYEVVRTKENGIESYKLEWKAPKRGVIKTASSEELDQYENLYGLTSQEIGRLKRVYQRLQGGYRADEKTVLETYLVGELFMQFKKYIPALLTNALRSKGLDTSLGQYKKVGRRNGEDVYEWEGRVVEGRWRVLGGNFLNLITFGRNPNYKWANLNSDQRMSMIEGYLTLSTLFLLKAVHSLAFSDIDDDDPFKKDLNVIIDTYSQQFNPFDLANTLKNPPATMHKGYKMAQATLEFLVISQLQRAVGNPEGTIQSGVNKGLPKGYAEFMRSWFPLSAIYDIQRSIETRDEDGFEKMWGRIR